MKDQTVELIKLINENKTLNEISEITGLSNRQLFMKLSFLKNSGYFIDKKYYFDGEIRYLLSNPFIINSSNEMTINMPNNVKKIKIGLLSDTHLGHVHDNIGALDKMTDIFVKEGIHTVLHAGDFFQGIYRGFLPYTKHKNSLEQISYGLKNYPYDKNIATYICLGNHDAAFWLEDGIDIKSILMDRRHDLVPAGYGRVKVNIGKNPIYLFHPIERYVIPNLPLVPHKSIQVKGHSHTYKIDDSNDGLIIHLPTMSSNMPGSRELTYPSFVIMELTLDEKLGVQNQVFYQYIFINNDFVKINEVQYTKKIPIDSNVRIQEIQITKPKLTSIRLSEQVEKEVSQIKVLERPNVETRQSDSVEEHQGVEEVKLDVVEAQSVKKLERVSAKKQDTYRGLSQIDKFNKRYKM